MSSPTAAAAADQQQPEEVREASAIVTPTATATTTINDEPPASPAPSSLPPNDQDSVQLIVTLMSQDARIPQRQTAEHSAFDLKLPKAVWLRARAVQRIALQIKIRPSLPGLCTLRIVRRSAVIRRFRVLVVEEALEPDGWESEVKIWLENIGRSRVLLPKHLRIAHLVVQPVLLPPIIQVVELDEENEDDTPRQHAARRPPIFELLRGFLNELEAAHQSSSEAEDEEEEEEP